MFSVFDQENKQQCTDQAMGTYIAPVPNFMQGYLETLQEASEDQGYDDWVAPDAAAYIDCVAFATNSQQYYLQLGCADGTSQALAVNIYLDNTCTQRATVDGYDDANIDVSALKVRLFMSCSVHFFLTHAIDTCASIR